MANHFSAQRSLRRPWRRYIDQIAEHRPALHAYCCRLTGSVWDGEDLAQDTLVRVFALLGRSDVKLGNPKASLIRTAANLWVDRVRRSAREEAALALGSAVPAEAAAPAGDAADGRPAATTLFKDLHPQERAALVMKDVLDLSLEETAAMLRTTVGAVKSAELVGGAEADSFEKARTFFSHAHMVMPALGFGRRPWWKVVDYDGEPLVAGFRTLDGVEGLNEVHRLEVMDGRIVRVRIYCFCPETLAVVAGALGVNALPRPHRSPSLGDVIGVVRGRQKWRQPRAQ